MIPPTYLFGLAVRSILLGTALGIGARAIRGARPGVRHAWDVFSILALVALPPISFLLPHWHPPGEMPLHRILPFGGDWLDGRIAFVLLAGAIVSGLPTAISILRTWRLRRRGRPVEDPRLARAVPCVSRRAGLERPLRVLVVDDPIPPIAVGIVRPMVLLPASARTWDDDWIEIVLLHEAAHVRRRDNLTGLVSLATCAALWFNPFVWIAVSRMRRDRELACDALTVRWGADPLDYADRLVSFASGSQQWRSLAFGTGIAEGSPLYRRVLALIEPRASPARSGRFASLAAAAVALLVALATVSPRAHL